MTPPSHGGDHGFKSRREYVHNTRILYYLYCMEKRSFVPNSQQRGPMPIFINDNIKAPNILVIDQNGQNIGILTRQKALELKDECGLDLVQISYDRDKMISTAKIVDYGKHQYEKGKEEKEKRKKQKKLDMKEIKI